MITVLLSLLNIYSLLVLARVLLSYFPNVDYEHPVVRFLYDVTEPVLSPIRQFLRSQFPNMGPFDFSPLVLLIGIMIFERIIIASLG